MDDSRFVPCGFLVKVFDAKGKGPRVEIPGPRSSWFVQSPSYFPLPNLRANQGGQRLDMTAQAQNRSNLHSYARTGSGRRNADSRVNHLKSMQERKRGCAKVDMTGFGSTHHEPHGQFHGSRTFWGGRGGHNVSTSHAPRRDEMRIKQVHGSTGGSFML